MFVTSREAASAAPDNMTTMFHGNERTIDALRDRLNHNRNLHSVVWAEELNYKWNAEKTKWYYTQTILGEKK